MEDSKLANTDIYIYIYIYIHAYVFEYMPPRTGNLCLLGQEI